MEYRKLGNSGLNVSVIGLGTNNFGNPNRIPDPAQSARVVHKCLDVGINFIDTAASYSKGESEVHIGEALKGRRGDAIVATKYNLAKLEGQSPRDRVIQEVEKSLRNLQTDYIDLYQIHFPSTEVSQEEVLEPLNELVEQGKVRVIGESNYSGWRHAQADATSAQHGWARFESSQSYYNLFRRQAELELLPFCTAADVGFLPYFPLAGGWLTGKYQSGTAIGESARRMVGQLQGDEDAVATLGKLDAYAGEHGHSVLDLAFSWLLAHPAVSSVIAGAMTEEQVEANAKAGDWKMTIEERDAIDAIAPWGGTGNEVESYGMGGAAPLR
ncbi:MAG: aldo/keto reductase [Chloroflexi bacterium]|nr:aldo/keto reductase [Chloroflexota bacterium]